MTVTDDDRVLLSRLLDGGLGDLEQRSLRSRIEREPALAAAFRELEAGRDWFARARSGAPPAGPTPGFADRVLDKVRRLPDPAALAEASAASEARALVFVRRLVVAALLLLGASVLLTAGLWTAADADRLEASPAEIEQLMEQLDEAIESGAVETAPFEAPAAWGSRGGSQPEERGR